MTAPTELPPEEPVQPPPPQSPQAVATEEALEAAENSLTPIIAGLLISAAAIAALEAAPHGFGARAGLEVAAVITPKWILTTLGEDIGEAFITSMMTVIHPIVLGRLAGLRDEAPTPMLFGGPDLNETAREATMFAIEQAQQRLIDYAVSDRGRRNQDIYDMFDDAPQFDPRSAPQRRAEGFARRMARWLTREAIFRGQELLGPAFGFTHKRWLTERDSRVRTEHRGLDGKVVRIGQTFRTETGTIRYPGDVYAPPHLVINCRCSLEWLRR